MNPHDPFQQPQGGSQPQYGPLNPGQPSIQPQVVAGEPLYDAAPSGGPASASSVPMSQSASGSFPQPAPQQNGAPSPAPQPVPATLYTLPPKPPKTWMIVSIIMIVAAVGLAAGFVWAMLQYIDHRDNVDSKVTSAVAEAVKKQADDDAAAFLEKEKEPNRLFVGPDDYGRLAFNYPKTWSTYVDKDALKGGSYAAYLNPVVVPPVSTVGQQFALRILIEEKDYDKVVESYRQQVQKGELKSSAVKADDQNGTRLEGMFTKNIRGTAVIFKIRDKTVTMQTDADVFRGDFDAIIKTVTFNR